MGTKNKNLWKNRLYNKWNTIFRNTLNAFLDDMVTILVTNTFQNRILELVNYIDLPVHINYLQNLYYWTSEIVSYSTKGLTFTGSSTGDRQNKPNKSKPIMPILVIQKDDNNLMWW
jgi:hypothetical protein